MQHQILLFLQCLYFSYLKPDLLGDITLRLIMVASKCSQKNYSNILKWDFQLFSWKNMKMDHPYSQAWKSTIAAPLSYQEAYEISSKYENSIQYVLFIVSWLSFQIICTFYTLAFYEKSLLCQHYVIFESESEF